MRGNPAPSASAHVTAISPLVSVLVGRRIFGIGRPDLATTDPGFAHPGVADGIGRGGQRIGIDQDEIGAQPRCQPAKAASANPA
jgi:hypothetical protein